MTNKFKINIFKEYLKGNSTGLNLSFILSFTFSIISILLFNYFIGAFFSFNNNDFSVGEPAKNSYIVKDDFKYLNSVETEVNKELKSQLALSVYRLDNDIAIQALGQFDIYSNKLLLLLNSDLDNQSIISELNKVKDGVLYLEDLDSLSELDINQVVLNSRIELKRLFDRGYIVDNKSGNGSGLITIISNSNNSNGEISAVSVLKSIDFTHTENSSVNNFIKKLIYGFIVPNCFYDNEQTKYQKKLILDQVEPVYNNFRKGDIIVDKGVVVSNLDFDKIVKAEDSIKNNFLSAILLVIGFVTLIYIAGITLLNKSFIHIKLKERDKILILWVTLFYVVLSCVLKYFIYPDYAYIYPYLIPTVLITIVFTFLYNGRLALYMGVLLSLMLLIISNFSVYAFFVNLILSIIGSIIVHKIDRRIDLLKSTWELVLISILLSIFFLAVGIVDVPVKLFYFVASGLSALIYGILQLVILPISEHALKISTCFQLKELSDLNAPLLKSMLIKAPGTYAHSVAVANMAESAAENIGVNPLLAKAGGYYHDIGKIDQPHYFIENQKGGKNVHDDMKASLSVAVIKSHVKLGIEKAKNIGLPEDIIDIIEQHHGKSTIKFFLDKAQKDNKGANVIIDDFRYGGPNPGKPEAAIVMLADSVEAAVRSLKSPTISQLHKFIWDIILNKLKDGMLDACGMTLSDLNTIKNSFVNTLVGYYHSRIEYPSEDV